jgi:hypothetical protein
VTLRRLVRSAKRGDPAIELDDLSPGIVEAASRETEAISDIIEENGLHEIGAGYRLGVPERVEVLTPGMRNPVVRMTLRSPDGATFTISGRWNQTFDQTAGLHTEDSTLAVLVLGGHAGLPEGAPPVARQVAEQPAGDLAGAGDRGGVGLPAASLHPDGSLSHPLVAVDGGWTELGNGVLVSRLGER